MECDMGIFDFFRSRSSSLRGRNSSAKSATAASADVPPQPPASARTAPPAAPSKATANNVPLPPASAPAALDSMATTMSAASSSTNNNDDSDSDGDMVGHDSKPPAAPASLGSIQNYEIVKELGRGATAVVQLGKQKDGEQLVALKVFKTSLLKKMREVKRVGRRMVVSTALDKVQIEIAIMKKLQHPHLLNLLEVFDDDSETLVLMLEYAPHGQVMHWDTAARVYTPAATSATALAGKRVFDEDELRKCARQLLLGLEYLHENNICHRDLKPENILIGADGVYKIADFGVAHLFDETTSSDTPATTTTDAPGSAKKGYVSSTAGTYAFMAPETLKGGAYDAYAADIWALGITLYALALGTIPFYDPDVVTLFEQIEHTPITLPISDSNNNNSDTGVSSDFAAFLYGLLEKEPEKRWSLKQCKQHAWVLDGLDESATRAFLDTHNEAVTVNSADVANAVTKVSSFNVLLRVKLGANRWLRKAQKSSDERKRASLTSNNFSHSSLSSSSMSSVDESLSSALEQKAPVPVTTSSSRTEQLADNQAEI